MHGLVPREKFLNVPCHDQDYTLLLSWGPLWKRPPIIKGLIIALVVLCVHGADTSDSGFTVIMGTENILHQKQVSERHTVCALLFILSIFHL